MWVVTKWDFSFFFFFGGGGGGGVGREVMFGPLLG